MERVMEDIGEDKTSFEVYCSMAQIGIRMCVMDLKIILINYG